MALAKTGPTPTIFQCTPATLGRLWRGRRGAAAVEAALAGTAILLPLSLGTAQFGIYFSVQAGLDNALQAGIATIWSNGAVDANKVKAAAQASWGSNRPQTLVVATPASTCYCLTPTGTSQGATAVLCNATCGTGTALATYTTLTMSAAISPLTSYSLLGGSFTITSTGTVRTS